MTGLIAMQIIFINCFLLKILCSEAKESFLLLAHICNINMETSALEVRMCSHMYKYGN